MKDLTSRERYLKAFKHEEADRVPIFLDVLPVCFYTPEVNWWNQFEKAEKLLELGCDPMINIWLPTPVPLPEVDIKVWREKKEDGRTYIGKEFVTPKGNLRQIVEETDDWTDSKHNYWVQQTLGSGEKQSYGIDVFDDWNISRRTEPWVKGPEDLDKLRYVLGKPKKWELDEWRHDTERAMEFARKHHLLTYVRRTVVSDASQWFCGIEWFIYQLYDNAEFVKEFLSIFEDIAKWQAELALEFKPDVFQRRGWYDTPEFWGGEHFDNYILPSINKEAKLVHEAGTLHSYLLTEGWGPYLKKFEKLETDILWGLDPYRNKASMQDVKNGVGKAKTVLGGISNERDLVLGTPEKVRESVRNSIQIMAPGGGFVLGASASVQRYAPWENIAAMIDEAHKTGKYQE